MNWLNSYHNQINAKIETAGQIKEYYLQGLVAYGHYKARVDVIFNLEYTEFLRFRGWFI